MRKQKVESPAAELQHLFARVRELQQVEERLTRDLQTCIDATNKLLERIGEASAGKVGGAADDEQATQREGAPPG